MSFFRPAEALTQLGSLTSLSHSVVIGRPANMVRVAATPFEQQNPPGTNCYSRCQDQSP